MKDQLRNFITLFLQLNAEPADFQVHALAEALGCDKETLEGVIYAMLGREVNNEVTASEEEVLEDVYPPDQISVNDITLNDSAPTAPDPDYTSDDGVDALDQGIGDATGDLLIDDGVPDRSL
jgi:hypothetical protein